jgi:hypothetical protein
MNDELEPLTEADLEAQSKAHLETRTGGLDDEAKVREVFDEFVLIMAMLGEMKARQSKP